MKNIIFTVCLLMAAMFLTAQEVPQAINFQAIARDANSEIMANTPIMIQLTILDGSPEGTQVYREIRSLTTNNYGSFSFQIGRDPYISLGEFADIDWGGGRKFLKIDYDPTATLSFNLSLGTIEFVSVPYAFAAGSVSYIDATDANDGDVLAYNAATGRFEPVAMSGAGGGITVETDPTVPDWAKADTKPTYDYSEIQNAPDMSNLVLSETDPTVPTWAKSETKPAYDYSEIANTPNLSGYLTEETQTLADVVSQGNSVENRQIKNLATPTDINDAANKAYVDSEISRLSAEFDNTVTYTLSFNANGGSGTMQPQIFNARIAQALSANVFTKENNRFNGWNTAADGSGTAYNDMQVTAIASDITLYAQWLRSYSVTFNANGGTGTMETCWFTPNVEQALPTNVFTKENCRFAGWNTAADGSGTSYTDMQTITLLWNMTLYAQWEILTYRVTFNSNGGVGTMQPQTFIAGSIQVLTANAFIYENRNFAGWNTAADGSGTAYGNSQSIMISSSMTLYAQWEATYIVTFNANGGTGTMLSQSFTADIEQTLYSNAFSKADYYFANWNTAADGTGISYTNGQSITVLSDMTLYAQWRVLRGSLNEHDWVDLGLPSGLLWATCNIGSTTPEEYGNYYAWGETTTKSTYTSNNYSCTTNPGILPSNKDAASVIWGANWRMPTKAEFEELNSNCTVIWITQNGIYGRRFTGPNGNSIFLPAAGYRSGSGLYNAGSSGYYWSSSLGSSDTSSAWYLYFDSGDCSMDYGYRYYGRSVRAVCQSQN